jgi:hypothetical protein
MDRKLVSRQQLELYSGMDDNHLADVINRWSGWNPVILGVDQSGNTRPIPVEGPIIEHFKSLSSPNNCRRFIFDVLGRFRIVYGPTQEHNECNETILLEDGSSIPVVGKYSDYNCYVFAAREAISKALPGKSKRSTNKQAASAIVARIAELIRSKSPTTADHIEKLSPELVPAGMPPSVLAVFLGHLNLVADSPRFSGFCWKLWQTGFIKSLFIAPGSIGGQYSWTGGLFNLIHHLIEYMLTVLMVQKTCSIDDIVFSAYLCDLYKTCSYKPAKDGKWEKNEEYKLIRGCLPQQQILDIFSDIMTPDLENAVLLAHGGWSPYRDTEKPGKLAAYLSAAHLICCRMFGHQQENSK